MWYQVTRNPQEFHKLTGCQRDPRIWGVTNVKKKKSENTGGTKCVFPNFLPNVEKKIVSYFFWLLLEIFF